jgi:hypothetical protein
MAETTTQPAPTGAPPAVPPQAEVSVIHDAGRSLVSVGPGPIGCRSLLREIAERTRIEVRNLALVPDDAVYVQMRDAAASDAVARVLRVAKVDYVLRGDVTGQARALLLISDRPRGAVTAARADTSPASGLPAARPRLQLFDGSARDAARSPFEPGPDTSMLPAPVELPAIEAPADGSAPVPVPLDVRPEVVQMGPAPAWQAIDVMPTQVEVPPEMVPTPFAITTPPAPAPSPIPSSFVVPAATPGVVRGYSPNVPSAPVPGPIPATTVPVAPMPTTIAPLTTPAPAPPPQ